MLFNLLTEAAENAGNTGNGTASSGWGTWLMMGILLVIIIVFMIINRNTQKKQEEETKATLNALKPGSKVTTIGGICGVVAELCEDGTFILETGSENTGRSYLKLLKEAIYQTDARAEKKEEAPAEEKQEAPAEEAAEAPVEAPAEEKAE